MSSPGLTNNPFEAVDLGYQLWFTVTAHGVSDEDFVELVRRLKESFSYHVHMFRGDFAFRVTVAEEVIMNGRIAVSVQLQLRQRQNTKPDGKSAEDVKYLLANYVLTDAPRVVKDFRIDLRAREIGHAVEEEK